MTQNYKGWVNVHRNGGWMSTKISNLAQAHKATKRVEKVIKIKRDQISIRKRRKKQHESTKKINMMEHNNLS